jgi:diadenosine tetraphosphate (Ap4A) HIT family hydrolase
MAVEASCVFCGLPPGRIRAENSYAVLIADGYPVSPGHSLVIPKRHTASFFETTEDERRALLDLLDTARDLALAEHAPSGFNIGINDGAAAGQTVAHLHIHLIPRYPGDQEDPRGGVRRIFPAKADYWTDRK